MGIIKAVAGAVGGVLADSWLETIEPGEMSDTTVVAPGVAVNRKDKRGSNRKGTEGVISDGSIIHVGTNMMMVLFEGGKIIDFSSEEGFYEVKNGTAPSMFSGGLKESVADSFRRLAFGGTAPTRQKVCYINLQEIKGIRFGTHTPINYYDRFYNAELSLRAHGTYSIKITDPLKFLTEAVPRNLETVDIQDINAQYLDEFLSAMQSAINKLSEDGVRISSVSGKSVELSRHMAKVLDEEWNSLRGMEVCSVGLASVSYDPESQKLINLRNKGAMMSDPTIREGFVQTSIASGLEAAGSNPNGAAGGFMAMGMGMNAAGGFMQSASNTNAAQMQRDAAGEKANGNTWRCVCGNGGNTGKFCAECGAARPRTLDSWKCSCGQENNGRFCSQCGNPHQEQSGWTCSCGAVNEGRFCSACGAERK